MAPDKRKTTSKGAGVSPQLRSSRRRTAAADEQVPATAPVDKRIEQIKQSCPIKWNGADGGSGLVQSMDEEADVCLSVGWEKYPGEEGLIEKCLEYIDPEKKGQFANCDEEEFDFKAAEKALRKDGSICDIYSFTPEGEGDGIWTVNYQCKKTLTKEEALESLESLFDGEFCLYPEGYDNFGKTPFSGQLGSTDSKESDSGSDSKAEEKQTPLLQLKESVSIILDRASFVARSSWDGHCQNLEECDSQIEREDFFFFRTEDGQKFLFQFGWSYTCG